MTLPVSAEPHAHFNRTLTLVDAICIVISGMIGSGIFIVSSQVAAELQSGFLLIAVWLLAGLMALLGALAFGELAALWPQVGGQYVFIRNIWGRLPAFLFGWTLSFIIKSGTIAAVALTFIRFIRFLPFPLAWRHWVSDMMPGNISHKLAAIGLILLLTLLNQIGIKFVARIQNWVTVINVTSLLLLIGVGAFVLFGSSPFSWDVLSIAPLWSKPSVLLQPNSWAILGCALVGPAFAFDGWSNVTMIAAEVSRPTRNLPLALFVGVSLTALLYCLVNVAYLVVLPLPAIIAAKEGVIAANTMKVVLGSPAQLIIILMMLLAAFGCLNNMILSGSRAMYALAEDGFLASGFSQLGKRSKVPENALWVQAAWSSFLVLSSAFEQLLDYMVFAVLLFSLLTVVGLLVLRRKSPQEVTTHQKGWRVAILPLGFCLLCVWVLLSLLILRPMSSGISLVIILTGWPIYYLIEKKSGLLQADF
jgi:APA family basic amino acid/polyamine antiporter